MDGVCSICDTDGPTRVIYLGKGIQYQGRKKTDYLVSDSKGEAKKWVGNLGKEICEQSDSIFVRLENSPLPPDFGETYTVREVFRIIRDHASNYSRSFFNSWLRKTLLPVTVIFSVPLPADLGRSLVGIRFNPASGEAARRGRKGFRAERVPAERQLSFSQDALTIRLFVNRLDAGFLVPRTGGVVKIVYRTVAVIGCGSVGSYTIEMLTRLGIGKLTLVDKETLGVENIHRHSLGFDAIGKNKAEAVRLSLSLRYPHLQIESFTQSIEELLQSKPEKVTGADVIVIALGDENLERFLNRHLHGSRPRVHVWLEPLGLAQHVLVADLNLGAGCYECLFESSKDKGLRNMAALAAPGQDLQKSFAGCGGTFAQFSAVDSSQAANLAATLTVKVLSGELTENVLLTRHGDPSTFLQAGFKIAERATLFKPGQVIESTNFSRQDCLVCINQG